MAEKKKVSRWKIILRAWPPAGAALILLSFLVTGFWAFYSLIFYPGEFGWLEPLSAFLAGAGAFLVAAILIFRKIDSARVEADANSLSRGLATGYYFNFLKPLVTAIDSENHPIHTLAAEAMEAGGHKIVGIVSGIPEHEDEFKVENHDALIDKLDDNNGGSFKVVKKEIEVKGRPRPVHFKFALSTRNNNAIIVDIPTTLSVIADFAEFVAKLELEDNPDANDQVANGRKNIVADIQAEEFSEVLLKFIKTVSQIGSHDTKEQPHAPLLHIVPMRNLMRRMDELADH